MPLFGKSPSPPKSKPSSRPGSKPPSRPSSKSPPHQSKSKSPSPAGSSKSGPQSFNVYKLRFNIPDNMSDPHISETRYHTTLFVETDPDTGHGKLHHVTGDITRQAGMTYEMKNYGRRPENSRTFHSKELLGQTPADKHPDAWQALLRQVPAPPKQKDFNMKTMKTEPFKTQHPLTFYGEGEQLPQLVKCTEWTEVRAVPRLWQAGFIKEAS